MTTEIATRTAPVSFEQMHQMARAFSKSGMFGAKTEDQALSLLLLAQAEGVHPAMAMRDFDIIQGRPSKKAQAMLRDFLATGGKVEWHKRDDTGADATFSHPQGGSVRVSWDEARAKKAGLSSREMYGKYARQMYSARVVSEGCRTVYPAATSGLYTPQEAAAMEPVEKNMGAAPVVHDDDEDITQQIPGTGPDVAPPQESPPPSPTPAGGVALINTDQETVLRDRFNDYEPRALAEFLRIAKRSKLSEIQADEFDGALEWCDGNLAKHFKKAAKK